MTIQRAMQLYIDVQWGDHGFEAFLEVKAVLGGAVAAREDTAEARPPVEALA